VIGTDLIVVGGQALAYWMDHYSVSMPANFSYVSHDLDLLARSAAASDDVRRIARAIGGRSVLPQRRAALTALVGQAVKEISAEEFYNVDVLHTVYGAEGDIRGRAVEVEAREGLRFRVMHPLDVLKSRLDNLYGLREKQNDLGHAQLAAAIEVARAFLRDAEAGRPRLRYLKVIRKLARSDAGKKVAARYGIRVADLLNP
jgi:hypothetical protein